MLKTGSNFVLGRTAPYDVPQGYASVVSPLAALLDGRFEQSRPDNSTGVKPLASNKYHQLAEFASEKPGKLKADC
ncbi:conserved hypothetical protein [Nitrospira defluvii]|uniref:Uncharacterized protein n=1 Tax=Nitrospira defluvii TaxID=330214 RepID=A0ABM8RPX5_9BACT|nr:conserved hypothetical protein [Nitrospira defluvii]